jgi:hypothetical protein
VRRLDRVENDKIQALKPAMWREKVKFELIGCGLMLLAFVIASSIGVFMILMSSSAELAAAVMVVSVANRLGG